MKLTYNNIDNALNFIIQQLNRSYDIFINKKTIIVCGNGINGYSTHSSKFIDSHDLVVRINNYVTIEPITGLKKDLLFVGASVNKHLTPEQFYPEIGDFPVILSNKDVLDKVKLYKNISNSCVILHDRNFLVKITKYLGYNSIYNISGIHCSLLCLAIAKKFNSQINFIGFDIENKNKSYETYYYGNRSITNSNHLKHDWNFHSLFFKILYDRFTFKNVYE